MKCLKLLELSDVSARCEMVERFEVHEMSELNNKFTINTSDL